MFFLMLVFGQVTLPAEIKGTVGSFITIKGQTEGTAIRFVPLSQGIQLFPSNLLTDPKATVAIANKPGRYRILAYSAINNSPTDPAITSVVVTDDIDTKPLPDQLPSQIVESITSIYGGIQDKNKASMAGVLATIYLEGAALCENGITLRAIQGGMTNKAKALEQSNLWVIGSLRPIQEAVERDISFFSKDESAPLQSESVLAIKSRLQGYANLLTSFSRVP